MRALFILPLLLACAAPEGSSAMSDDGCRVLFDFSQGADRARWRAQNDTVMGGNSDGEVTETEDALVFAGDLVTRGGGFVQMNADLPSGALTGMTTLRLVGDSEGRPWRVRFETDQRVPRDAMRGRGDEGERAVMRSGPDMDGPRVAFSAPLTGWTDGAAAADLTDPEASTRGRPVPGVVWAPERATNIGLILADGRDAPFRLTVRRIEACR